MKCMELRKWISQRLNQDPRQRDLLEGQAQEHKASMQPPPQPDEFVEMVVWIVRKLRKAGVHWDFMANELARCLNDWAYQKPININRRNRND